MRELLEMIDECTYDLCCADEMFRDYRFGACTAIIRAAYRANLITHGESKFLRSASHAVYESLYTVTP